ncbi:MAG: HaeIII family restriction endonuclease [Paludibacteraceae bacterium]|nr:HaeIII family restriction endonuclease [Paludibacteraceae bacterium]
MFFFFDFGDEENAQLKRKANAGIQVKNGKAFDVKHSRLGRTLDFGEQWVGVPCSQQYWDDIKPIFDYYKTAA